MIGIFDSGLGGLTAVRAILRQVPDQDIIYFGDTARVPYGSKSAETIKQYAIQNSKWLINRGADSLVIACHSAASVAGDYVRQEFETDNFPVFDVIKAGLDEALAKTKGRIGIIGTKATIFSGVHKKYLLSVNPQLQVWTKACPLLVPLVEEGYLDQPETTSILAKYLKDIFENEVDTLVLACTHYPLLKAQIRSLIPKGVTLVDPAEALALEVKLKLPKSAKKRLELVFSDESSAAEAMIKNIFGQQMSYSVNRNAPLA